MLLAATPRATHSVGLETLLVRWNIWKWELATRVPLRLVHYTETGPGELACRRRTSW
jgi:hypothetical protein